MAHDRPLDARLAEQAALLRVATLVAEGATADVLLSSVVAEVGTALDIPIVTVDRLGPGPSTTVLAAWGDGRPQVGSTRPARIDDSSGVAAPIAVDGALWGMIRAGAPDGTLSPDAETRLAAFADLVGTGIASIEARSALDRIADEQAALRRVATLVAKGASPDELFSAVIAEVGNVLGLPDLTLDRFEPDRMVRVLASQGDPGFDTGSSYPRDDGTLAAAIFTSGVPSRIDDYSKLEGTVGTILREGTIRSAVGVPILVEDRIWGFICAAAHRPEDIPTDSEARLARFTDLVATAISNASTRADLIASRARIVAAADDARRRIERDLHDGTQQSLLALALDLQRVRSALAPEQDGVRTQIEQIEHGLGAVLDDVRELSRGLHPALLSRGGLGPALRAIARRSGIPVDLQLEDGSRLPESLEICVYYVVSEALTNAAKHSHADGVTITLRAAGGALHASIEDDGIGGAHASPGSGLIGLRDRVEALGGRFTLDSPAGAGTRITIVLPRAL
jgi:signal transduction histidine kinase